MALGIGHLGVKPMKEVALVVGVGQAVTQGSLLHLLLKDLFQLVGVRELEDRGGAHLDLVTVLQDGAANRVAVE